MRILINDKPVYELTPKLVKSLMLAKVQVEVKARVLTPAEATESYIKRTKRWITVVTVVALVFMVVVVIAGLSYEPRDAPIVIPVMLLSAGALILLVVYSMRRRVRLWNAKLLHRTEGLPPAGTAIFLDDKALSIGSDILAWPSLVIEQIELTRSTLQSGETSTIVHSIEHLLLKAGAKSVVLDRAIFENGALLVDNAWRKLQPAR
jgi:hypothetical protein